MYVTSPAKGGCEIRHCIPTPFYIFNVPHSYQWMLCRTMFMHWWIPYPLNNSLVNIVSHAYNIILCSIHCGCTIISNQSNQWWCMQFSPGTLHDPKIMPLNFKVQSSKIQCCTRSINPNVTCAEHLIVCKSLPIHSPEHICTTIKNFEDSVFELLKLFLTYCFRSTLHSCAPSCLFIPCISLTGAMKLWTLNFELAVMEGWEQG